MLISVRKHSYYYAIIILWEKTHKIILALLLGCLGFIYDIFEDDVTLHKIALGWLYK